MIDHRLKYDPKRLVDYCKQNNIKRLAVFGSAIHGTMGPNSDLDLLVDLKMSVGYFRFVRMEEDLGNIFEGCKRVDLLTRNSLSKFFRDEVVKECEVIYEER